MHKTPRYYFQHMIYFSLSRVRQSSLSNIIQATGDATQLP
jgi:hypothetical protein